MSLASRVAELATRIAQEIKPLKDRPIVQTVNIVQTTSVNTRARGTVTLTTPIDGTRPWLATASPIGISVSTSVMPIGTVSHPGGTKITQVDLATTALMTSAGDITWSVQVIGYPAPA
ncbi:hypothetical protein [Microbacterium sp. KNMS]